MLEYILYYLLIGFVSWVIIALIELYDLYANRDMYDDHTIELKYRLSWFNEISWRAVVRGAFIITLLWVWAVPFYFLQDML